MPEVSLVAVMDADKEGFLRSHRSLVQIIGRAARHIEGRAIFYADKITESMAKTIKETKRRRKLQLDYNEKHNISPKTVVRSIADLSDGLDDVVEDEVDFEHKYRFFSKNRKKLKMIIKDLDRQMLEHADKLEFELASIKRDEIEYLKQLLNK